MKSVFFTSRSLLAAAAIGIGALSVATLSHAGTTGTEFQIVYDTLTDWVNGYLGRTIAFSFLILGLMVGIARQSLIAIAVSGACGFGLLIAPTVLDNILSATVTDETFVMADVVAPAAPAAMIGVN